MEIRARGAIRCSTASQGQAGYRRVPAPVRPVRHRFVSSRQSSGEFRESCLDAVDGEGPLVSPHGPDDAGELVRHRDGGDIVAAALLRRPRPRLQGVRVGTLPSPIPLEASEALPPPLDMVLSIRAPVGLQPT